MGTANPRHGDDKQTHVRGLTANYVELFSALASRSWIGGTFGIPNEGRYQESGTKAHLIAKRFAQSGPQSIDSVGVASAGLRVPKPHGSDPR
jgi:hypothetical protein